MKNGYKNGEAYLFGTKIPFTQEVRQILLRAISDFGKYTVDFDRSQATLNGSSSNTISVPDLSADWKRLFDHPEINRTIKGELQNQVSEFVEKLRQQSQIFSNYQIDAYKRIHEIAEKVVSGTATEKERQIIELRDVDITINSATGKLVGDVDEAASLILQMSSNWSDILERTDVFRKRINHAVVHMTVDTVPDDLESWLYEEFSELALR